MTFVVIENVTKQILDSSSYQSQSSYTHDDQRSQFIKLGVGTQGYAL